MLRRKFPSKHGLDYFSLVVSIFMSAVFLLIGLAVFYSIITGTGSIEFPNSVNGGKGSLSWIFWLLIGPIGFYAFWHSVAPLTTHEVMSDEPIEGKMKSLKKLLGNRLELEAEESNYMIGWGKTGFPIFKEGKVMILCLEDKYVYRIMTHSDVFRTGTMDFGSERMLGRRIKKSLTTGHTL
jgi:hypothetical protein